MPYRPKTIDRPWITKRVEQPGQGRKVINLFYQSKEWKRLRNIFIKGMSTHLDTTNPHPNAICIQCYKEGRVTKTHTIDHIKPINPSNSYDTIHGRYGQPLEWTNLQPLCLTHTAQKNNKDKQL
jgi:hypothetical protein